jgi:CheY-like chemotaxis protein
LIVDDERIVADTLGVIFTEKGYDVRAAHSAEQALEIVAEWPPDLAILDVVLPKMHGIDLAILLREQLPSCQTLLFSGQAFTDDLLSEFEKRGYNFALLRKPIHPSSLLNTAAKLLTGDKEKQT